MRSDRAKTIGFRRERDAARWEGAGRPSAASRERSRPPGAPLSRLRHRDERQNELVAQKLARSRRSLPDRIAVTAVVSINRKIRAVTAVRQSQYALANRGVIQARGLLEGEEQGSGAIGRMWRRCSREEIVDPCHPDA